MSKVTYEYLFDNKPLYPTYMQLQMADQSIQFLEGIAKVVIVRIHDHYAPTDFMVLDMGEEEDDTPIILGRPFLNTTNAIIYVRSVQVYFQVPGEKVCYYFNSYTTYEQPRKSRYRRRRRSSRNQKNQSPKNEWEEDKEPKGVVKDEPAPPKSSSQTKQVWKEKVTLSPKSQEAQSSESPSPGLDVAPIK